MPEPPFRLMFLARSQSGKTTLLVKLLLYFWINKFNKIYIFCPTYSSDRTWKPVDKYRATKKVVVYPVVTERRLNAIWKEAEDKKLSDDSDYHVCVIMDDCVGQKDFKTDSVNGVVNKLVCKGNHANITTIWSIQKLTLCSTIMRMNVEGIVMFYQQDKELKAVHAEFGIGNSKQFMKLCQDCTTDNYHTLYINRKGPGRPDYYHNFKIIDVDNYLTTTK